MLFKPMLTILVFLIGATCGHHYIHGQTSPTLEPGVSPSAAANNDWTQWRGPNRDGKILDANWPESLDENVLTEVWSASLAPSYSGPLVVGNRVFVTETKDKKTEVVTALNIKTGEVLWAAGWQGAMQVPFFAASNGSWIRATPAYANGKIYVAGMKDVLVCLIAETGERLWTVDFPAKTGSPNPNFGFVSSPLIDGEFVYVQAGGAFTKLNKDTGEIVWQSLKDGGGMSGSAFSSPVIATVAGKRQAIVMTRGGLSSVELESGNELWSRPVKTYRGMNILTPTIFGDSIFTSTYGGTTQLISVSSASDKFSSAQKWSLPVQGYMSSPVVIDGHAYVHLRNQRFACFDLEKGVEKWRTKPFGKYSSLIASGDKILALDERGELLLIRANSEKFELIDRRTVGDDSWAHVAVSGKNVVVRNLDKVTLFQWGE